VHAVTVSGRSALMFAAIYGSEETLAELLRLGADARHRDANGTSALDMTLRQHAGRSGASALLRAAVTRAAEELALAFVLCLGARQDRAAQCAALHGDLVAGIARSFLCAEYAATRVV